MKRLVAQIQALIRELRRRQVIRVAVVYATTGFVILQLAEILVDPFGLGPWALRLITLVLILGFPLAVGLAWVYNLTEEGVVQAGEEEQLEPGSSGTALTSNGLIVGLLVVAIGLLLYPRVFPSGEKATGPAPAADTAEVVDRSIAVLPFDPLSSGEESRTFARGVHDDLLARLSNISDLTVISRTSVERYRDTDLPLPAIADSLGVRWVMEGGVQKAEEQIQVRAQLIDPRTDGHVWAEDYRRSLSAENLFAVQGEITREIADALQAKLTAGEQSRVTGAPTENLKAYRLYVKGRSQLDTRTEEGMRRAVDYFRLALQEDSTFALAWSGLAEVQALSYYASDSLGAPVPSLEEAARWALELDPDLVEAHASMGQFYWDQQDAPAALHHLRRSVELKPSYAQAHHWLGYLQLQTGRPEKALRHMRRATELSPKHVAASRVLIWAQLANGRFEEALREARRGMRMAPSSKSDEYMLDEARVLNHLGRHEEAQKVAREALAQADISREGVEVFLRVELALAELAGGDERRARRLAKTDELPPEARALLHAVLSELDAAYEIFLGADFKFGAYIIRYLYPDLLSEFREDPRYEALIRRINTAWGLNPDGSIPEGFDASSPTDPEADA